MTNQLERLLDHRASLILALLIALVWGFWSPPLYDLDEGAFTEATREMMASGNYISIYLNGEPRHDKPILIYWLQAASAHLFGLNEFALRLPSVIAALAWVLAIFHFTRHQFDVSTAQVAALLVSLSLFVSLIAKAAVADALLNLFIVLAMLDMYRQSTQPSANRLRRLFIWLGLGFLTKGPVALFFPLVVSFLFYISYGRWREWLRQVFDPMGIALFFAIVLPWHIAVYLDTGWAFFDGFYLHHNLDRYNDPMEGHSGGWFYFILIAPLLVMPFATWLISQFQQLGQVLNKPLDRYLWLWFFVVLLTFSFSGTKLPHYMLYGMSGLLILMAADRHRLSAQWLHLTPLILWFGLLAALPQLFGLLAQQTDKTYDQLMFQAGANAFSGWPQTGLIIGALIAGLIALIRLALWRRLILIGFIQATMVSLIIVPTTLNVLQQGPKQAALYAKAHNKTLVFNRAYQPSVSLYREQIIKHQPPKPGQWVYVREDHLAEYLAQSSPYRKSVVFRHTPAVLVAIE